MKFFVIFSALVLAAPVGVDASDPATIEFFESKIRPVLAQECYDCHSEATKRKGGLLLDSRAGWQAGGDSGAAIVPGNPGASLLMRSISHAEEELKMPKAGAKLEEVVLADFRRWIEMGAPDPRDEAPTSEELTEDTSWEAIRKRRESWWSFQPIQDPAVPPNQDAKRPIDAFIRARLEESGMTSAVRAEPRVLHRRVRLVLTGTPPSLDESNRFLEGWSENPDTAYERLVGELLEEKGFAERWARHWMDWTRYADTHGSEGDPAIPHAWRYRDYLIRALDQDVPCDQLIREHIAGDLLEHPRVDPVAGINESALGTGHLRMVFHGFAPTDALDERVRFTDDQINTVTKSFMGLTVSCARCHDHKFDAISQADYYALFGIFTSPLPATVAVDAPGILDRNRSDLAAMKPKIQSGVADFWREEIMKGAIDFSVESTKEMPPLAKFLESFRGAEDPANVWQRTSEALRQEEENLRTSRSKDRLRKRWDLTDSSEVAQWTSVGEGLHEEIVSPAGEWMMGEGGEAIARILPSGVYSGALSTKHRAFLASPAFDLDGEYELYLNVLGSGASARFAVQHYPRSGTVYPVTKLTKEEWRWVKYPKIDYWNGDQIHLELATSGEAPILVSDEERSWFGIREAVLVRKGAPDPTRPGRESLLPLFGDSPVPENWREAESRVVEELLAVIAKWEKNGLSDPEALMLDDALRAGWLPNQLEELPVAVRTLVERYRELEEGVPSPTRAPGVVERPGIDQPLYNRGNHKKPGDPVPRRFLEAVDAIAYETRGSGRREFAEDLLRDDNPFTARVLANRVWTHLFGNGLVATVDNFGRLGEKPSHPELLDYLASRFRGEMDWSLKELVREIVMSSTWQQASAPTEKAIAMDPANRLLSSYPVQRLDAESIRDSLLAVSGELDPSRFGPPVVGTSPRRSVYVRVIRNNLDPFLTAFDFPVPASTVGKRNRTNVPAQSLTMMNDPFVAELASRWVDGMPSDASEEDRIRWLFETSLNRTPTESEIGAAMAFRQAAEREQIAREIERKEIEDSLTKAEVDRRVIVEPLRERLLSEKKERLGSDATKLEWASLSPMAAWDFEGDLSDSVGGLSGTAKGTARVEAGALVLDGEGFVETEPLDRQLKEKTLEVVVQLTNSEQRGGGVMTIQDLRGVVFDSIVYAERKSGEWLAGSERHVRTTDFGGGVDREASKRPVRLAWVYESDGTIHAFRDGEAYGKAIRVADPATFEKDDARLVFGLRHGNSPQGNKPIRGRILEARLYDRALGADEVRASAAGASNLFVAEREMEAALSEEAKRSLGELDSRIASLKSRLSGFGDDERVSASLRSWRDLAHGIFNLKEFLYLN